MQINIQRATLQLKDVEYFETVPDGCTEAEK
jgi:hypothetical protein